MDDFPIKGKLSNEKIRMRIQDHKYSAGFKPTEELLDSILEQFWFHDFYNSFISDATFLEYLIMFLDHDKPEKFNRYSFYRFLFDLSINNAQVKQGLWVIGLGFELGQSDSMELSRYKSFLESSFENLEGLKADSLVEKHLAKIEEKENEKYITWEHHTLTEFLTAEYINSQEDVVGNIKKYTVINQEGVVALKSSWYGVLRFLLESEKGTEIFSWLLDFLETYPENIDTGITEILTNLDIQISEALKVQVFNLIYNSFYEKVLWLPVWARTRLSKFVNNDLYKRLKVDIHVNGSEAEIYVRRGNVAAIIEGLLESNSELLTTEERTYWKSKLVTFANDKNINGVLQRHSLAALAKFRDEKVIPKVAGNLDSVDSLVRDAFLEFCGESAPNSKPAIDAFIKGVKGNSDIYARHGLYRVTDKEAIKYFFSKISKDSDFIKAFFKHEGVFDKENGDLILINTVRKFLDDQELIISLKDFIFSVFEIEDLYDEKRSNFINSIIEIIGLSQEQDFLIEVLERIKKINDVEKQGRVLYDFEFLIKGLLTKHNIKNYLEKVASFPKESQKWGYSFVDLFQYSDNADKRSIFDISEKLGKVKRAKNTRSEGAEEKWKKDRDKKVYDLFLKQLKPSPGQFQTSLFSYFIDNQKVVEERWSNEVEEEFKSLVLKLINKIDPKNFRLSIADKNNRQFTWSAQASYYSDLLSVVQVLMPDEIKRHRQEIINFIPYSFSPNKILELVPDATSKEFKYLNEVMMDQENDRRYLIPSTYIYIVQEYSKKGYKYKTFLPILKSFVFDKDITELDKQSALESWEYFLSRASLDEKKNLQAIFKRGSKEKSGHKRILANIANAILIRVFKDEESIDWRFKKIKEKGPFKGFKVEDGFHEVSEIESELDRLSFAKPLIDLKDKRYLPKYLDLLDYSLYVLDNSDEYSTYINYLWRVIFSFMENLKEGGSFKPFFRLEEHLKNYGSKKGSNWLRPRIDELRKSYVNNFGFKKDNYGK